MTYIRINHINLISSISDSCSSPFLPIAILSIESSKMCHDVTAKCHSYPRCTSLGVFGESIGTAQPGTGLHWGSTGCCFVVAVLGCSQPSSSHFNPIIWTKINNRHVGPRKWITRLSCMIYVGSLFQRSALLEPVNTLVSPVWMHGLTVSRWKTYHLHPIAGIFLGKAWVFHIISLPPSVTPRVQERFCERPRRSESCWIAHQGRPFDKIHISLFDALRMLG